MKTIVMSLLMLVSIMAQANVIHLYAHPSDSGKVVTTIKGGQQLIPIYYPKTGDWLKVANPSNGKVGWVRFSDLQGESGLPGMENLRFNQRLESSGKTADGANVVRVISYSGPKKLSDAEVRQLVKQMQRRQAQLNGTMELMLRAMVRDLNHFTHQAALRFEDEFFTFPVLQPMLMVPETGQKGASENAKTMPVKTSWWQRLKAKIGLE